MPEYRRQPSLQSDSATSQELNYQFYIQPSIEGTADRAAPVQTMFRISDPSLSSLVSEIVSGILNPPATVTR